MLVPLYAAEKGIGLNLRMLKIVGGSEKIPKIIQPQRYKIPVKRLNNFKDYEERLRNKIAALQEMTHGKRNVQVALVTTYGLKQNMYSGRVQRVATLEELFI